MENQALASPPEHRAKQPLNAASSANLTQYLLLAFLGALWGRLFWGLSTEWELDPQYAHGWFVPLLAGLLFLGRWNDRPAAELPGFARWLFPVSLFALVFLLPLKLLGVVYPEARPFQWMHAAVATGITLAAIWSFGGLRWLRHFAFPILFLLVSVPWARGFQNDVTNALMQWAASASVEIVLMLGIPAVQEGNTIALAGQVVGVDEACSGIRSLQGSIMAGLFLGEFFRLGAIARGVLLAAAVGFSLLLNVVRAALLTWICATSGAEGLARFHDPAGFAILGVVFVLSIGLASFLAQGSTQAPRESSSNIQPLFTRLTGGVCIAGLVWLALVEIGAAAYFKAPQKTAATVSWRMDYSRQAGTVESEAMSPSARQYLRYDTGESKVIDLPDGDLVRVIDLNWKGGEISAAGARTHSPTICLPALGYDQGKVLPNLSFSVGPVACQFKVASFEKNGRIAYVYHGLWESGAPATFESAGDQSLKSAIAAVKSRRRLGDTRVLLLLVAGPATEEEANKTLQDFLGKVIAY